MNRFKHLMVDLETLSTGSMAVICSIAAIPFDPYTGKTGEAYKCKINIQSCLDRGLRVDAETIYWWFAQSKEAQASLCSDLWELPAVLANLSSFIALELEQNYKIWAKGPSFDLSKLADAYRACKINIPWHHSNERCVRTELDGYETLVKDQVPFEGERHCAEADARHQIRQVHQVWKWKNYNAVMIRPDQDTFNNAMRDSLMKKIESGICVSVLTVDRCPFCVDTCRASANRINNQPKIGVSNGGDY